MAADSKVTTVTDQFDFLTRGSPLGSSEGWHTDSRTPSAGIKARDSPDGCGCRPLISIICVWCILYRTFSGEKWQLNRGNTRDAWWFKRYFVIIFLAWVRSCRRVSSQLQTCRCSLLVKHLTWCAVYYRYTSTWIALINVHYLILYVRAWLPLLYTPSIAVFNEMQVHAWCHVISR